MNDESNQQPTEAAVQKTQSFQERMAALVGRARGSSGPPVAPLSVAPSITVVPDKDRLILTVSKRETGYCRIFPAQYNSINDLPPGWVDENWSGPSPWCKVEGQPEHPEFEANLAALERALS